MSSPTSFHVPLLFHCRREGKGREGKGMEKVKLWNLVVRHRKDCQLVQRSCCLKHEANSVSQSARVIKRVAVKM